MGRMATYLVMASGLLLLFYFGGLLEGSASTSNLLLNALLNPQTLADAPIAAIGVAAITALALGGIFAGAFFAGNLDLIALSSFAVFLLNLLWSFYDVYLRIAEANVVLAVIIFAPLLILLILTSVEWWRGRD